MSRIALIGLGAIGGEVARGLAERGHEVGVLLRAGSVRQLAEGFRRLATPGDCLGFGPALAIEAAGHGAVAEFAAMLLEAGVDVLVSSVGALHEDRLLASLLEAARRGGSRIILPSGAVAGLDHLRAARGAAEVAVRYVSRKPPSAWADELARRGLPPGELAEPLTLYAGPAREAARLFPANLNVAATLAIAGVGLDATEVEVVADPAARGNTHEVRVTSALGDLELSSLNRPSPANPKTSAIVAASILAAVDQRFATIQFL